MLRHLPIAGRIAIAVAVPLVATIAFGAQIVSTSWRSMADAGRVMTVAAAGPAFGALAHELQAERGLTNAFLRNPADEAARSARQAQIPRAAVAAEGVVRVIDAFPEGLVSQAADRGRAFRARLADLATLRQQAEARAIDPARAFDQYTALIAAALAPVDALAQDARIGATARAAITYSSMLWAKEAAGLERGTGAGAFRPDGFNRDLLPRFVSLAAVQDVHLGMAERYGSERQADQIRALARDPSAAPVIELRERAGRAALQGATGVEALAWFRVSTARIDAMKRLEEQFAADLSAAVAEVASASRADLMTGLAVVILVSLGAVAAALVTARSVTRPLNGLTREMTALAGGDTSIALADADRRDEIGAMARAAMVFRDNAIRVAGLAAAEREREEQSRRERQALMSGMAESFESATASIVAQVARAAGELETAAAAMAGTAEGTARQSQVVAEASEETSQAVTSVASAAEEMAASVGEISGQIGRTTGIVAEAVEQAGRTSQTMEAQTQATQKIGEVVALINAIAAQTNLLALNATIEAARAGEAGKGFAVVAAEVKALATQTTRATEQIAEQVTAIQSATGESVIAIASVSETVGRIHTVTTSIASAIEEQRASTEEIARNIQQVSAGTDQVAGSIGTVSEGASETEAASTQVLAAARAIRHQSTTLQGEIGRFLDAVRADAGGGAERAAA